MNILSLLEKFIPLLEDAVKGESPVAIIHDVTLVISDLKELYDDTKAASTNRPLE